ncbi:expressed unknown protein [Seminavis robusta]|uniref:Uncharacterized protein n=1 Tax=Seminavis robusta TaxID=568900 RepID=A0A9N8H8Z6_9STRA|nr:expressed unknown protein [Seminavis robusta]|eukprot:Sro103_g052560.1 n/a (214) ;mRNA; r:80345-80986
MTMFKLFFLVLSVLLLLTTSDGFLVSVADEQDIEVVSNPHSPDTCVAGAFLDALLEPYHLIVKPMLTQMDTFQELSYAKVLTVPVPIYTMKQPARLSAAQLQFQLVLVKDVSAGTLNLIYEVPVPMEQAKDSWFPGYYWTPIIMGCSKDQGYNHVGWKFTKLEQNNSENDIHHDMLPHFYALMVKVDNKEKTEGLRVGGFKAPGWMVGGAIFS